MKRVLLAGVAGAVIAAAPVSAQEVEFDHKGLTFEGENVELNISGRLHLDTVSVDDELTAIPSETDLRRLRIDATLKLGDDFRFKVDGDVGGISTGLKNVWGEYRGIDNTSIKVGNFIAPFNGEDIMSSNNLKLMERALPSALAPNFLVGGAVRYRGDNWSITGGYFTDPIENDPIRSSDDGQSFVGRLVVAPVKQRKRVLHLAGAVEYRELDDLEPSRVSAQPEFGLSGISLVSTGTQAGVDSYTNYNFEGAYMQGPFLVKGQYITRDNDAPTLGDPTFSGTSFEAAWVLTGERQRYGMSNGTFGGIRPRHKYGAVEIAARYSTIDLSDALVSGGEQDNWTVGANWYVTRNVRFMANYVHAETQPNRNGLDETAEAIMGRFQIAY